MVRMTFLICIALLMSGCGLLPRTGTPSEALLIADAMSIPATDIPKKNTKKCWRAEVAQATAEKPTTLWQALRN